VHVVRMPLVIGLGAPEAERELEQRLSQVFKGQG
jgi:hypothetical protein